jgi:hypothetical protein
MIPEGCTSTSSHRRLPRQVPLGLMDVAHDDLKVVQSTRRQLRQALTDGDRAAAEPGGVNCTKRMSSLTAWSWSRVKPA